jgi:hypothetical protein
MAGHIGLDARRECLLSILNEAQAGLQSDVAVATLFQSDRCRVRHLAGPTKGGGYLVIGRQRT